MTVLTLRPSSAGDRAEWDGTNFNKVSDVNDATAINTTPDSITTVRDLYNLPDTIPATAIISNVRSYVRVKSVSATYKNTFYTIIKTEATEKEGSSFTESTAYADHYTDYAVNPVTLAAWTVAEINALQAGARSTTRKVGISYYVAYCAEIWVEVTYTLPAVANLKRLLLGVGL